MSLKYDITHPATLNFDIGRPSPAMTPRIAKVLIRVAGTLAGLLGLGMLCVAPVMLYHSFIEQNPWMIGLALFPFALAVYFVWVAYLVWFRFSPLAVRHICGALGFYGLTLAARLVGPPRDPEMPWGSFAFLGCLVVIYIAYKFASDRLSRWLFPKSASGVQT